MASKHEMKFALLGPSNSGKTTLLACMYRAFDDLRPGMMMTDGDRTFLVLKDAYNSLRNEASKGVGEFQAVIKGSENSKEFCFKLRNGSTSIPVKFYDYPGSWMMIGNPNNGSVLTMLKSANVIIIAINSPLLMEKDGDYCASQDIGEMIKKAVDNKDIGPRLILFVPIKCEKYLHSYKQSIDLNAKIREKFRSVIGLESNPTYKDKFAMAILPVETVGNAEFSRFKNGAEFYVRNGDKGFSPKNTDQPMRYVMSFLLNRYKTLQETSLWGRFKSGVGRLASFVMPDTWIRTIFGNEEIRQLAEYIKMGISVPSFNSSSGFEILCGRKLMGL